MFTYIYKIHCSKNLSTGFGLFLISYFYLSILLDVVCSIIEYSGQVSIRSAVYLASQENTKLVVITEPYLSLIDGYLVQMRNIMHFDFIIERDTQGIYPIVMILLPIMIILLTSVLIFNKIYPMMIMKIQAILYYIIYFFIFQPVLHLTHNLLYCYIHSSDTIISQSKCNLSTPSSVHIIILAALLILLYYILLSFISYFLFGNNRFAQNDCYNRATSVSELMNVNYLLVKYVLKILQIKYSTFIYPLVIFNCLYLCSYLYYYTRYIYFYNRSIQIVQESFIYCIAYASVISVVFLFLDVEEKGIIFIINILLCSPLAYLIDSNYRSDLVFKFQLCEENNHKSLEMYIDELISLFLDKNNTDGQMLLFGVFQYYIRTKEELNLKKIGQSSYYLPITNEYHYISKSNANKEINYIMLLNLIYDLFDYSIKKYSKDRYNYLLSFANFLNYTYGNKFMAIYIIQQGLLESTHLNQKVNINNLIESFNQNVYKHSSNQIDSDNLSTVFFFERLSERLISDILYVSDLQHKFWGKIISLDKIESYNEETINSNTDKFFFSTANSIYQAIEKIESLHSQLNILNPQENNITNQIYSIYRFIFLEEDEYISRNKQNKIIFTKEMDKYFNLFDYNSGCIIVDISEEIGKVINYTKNIPKMFNFSNTYFKDKNISIILPLAISENHNNYLRMFQKTGKQNLIENKNLPVIVRDYYNNALQGFNTVYFLPFLDN